MHHQALQYHTLLYSLSEASDFIYMEISEIIKTLRKSKGIKQKVLATKLDITPAYLSSIENNRKEPSLDLMKQLANYLGVPVGYFFIESYGTKKLSGKKKKVFSEVRKLLTEFLSLYG